MQPLGVHHVSVNVSDVDRAVEFYVGCLGFQPRDDRPEFGFPGAWLNAGGQQLHLIAAPVPEDRGQHFAIQVADLAATVAELRAKGLKVGEPSPVGTGQQSFVHDPDGNLVELHQAGIH
jgi:glyoxylase I family protein